MNFFPGRWMCQLFGSLAQCPLLKIESFLIWAASSCCHLISNELAVKKGQRAIKVVVVFVKLGPCLDVCKVLGFLCFVCEKMGIKVNPRNKEIIKPYFYLRWYDKRSMTPSQLLLLLLLFSFSSIVYLSLIHI